MKSSVLGPLAIGTILALFAPSLSAQVLHVNDRWDDCAILIDPSLTQEAWHQFVSEVGVVAHFRPLISAEPLGPRSFELALLNWGTMIDDADPAWNDTFSHPDPTHWLFEGKALMVPGLMLRVGITRRFDLGAYWTEAPEANYGFLGGQVQYNLLNNQERRHAASGRLSTVKLYGPEDMDITIYGIDFVASKDISRFSPYAGVGGYWSRGHETTSKVDLEDESVAGVQGMVGLTMSAWILRLGAEFNVSRVPGYSFKVAFGS